jgi:hypothetical protein
MELVITLRKEVQSVTEAQAVTNLVKEKLQNHPEIHLSSQVDERIEPLD